MARVNLQDYCNEARELVDARAYDEAIAICHHILKRYPKHVKTYQILGEACLEKGEFQEAKDVFMRLLDHADPENFAAYAGLGVLAEREGQTEQAIWYMERAFELAPSSDEVREALRRLYGKRDGVEPARIKLNKAALARLYARGGQYRQAIEEFRNLLSLETNRDRIDLKVSLAEALWRDGRREQAAELSREVLQKSTSCLKALLLLGKIEIEKGRKEEGQSFLEQARALDPESLVAQTLFGDQAPLLPQVVKIPVLEKQKVGVGEAEVSAAAPQEPPYPEAAEPVVAAQEAAGSVVTETAAAPQEPPYPEAVEPAAAVEEVAPPVVTEAEAAPQEPPYPAAAESVTAVEEVAAPVVAEAAAAPQEPPYPEAVEPAAAVEEVALPVVTEAEAAPQKPPYPAVAEPVAAVKEAAAPVLAEAAAAPQEPPYPEAAEPVAAVEKATAPVVAEAAAAPQEPPYPEAAEPVETEAKPEATAAAAEETAASLPEAAPELARAVVTPAPEQVAPVAAVAKAACAEETGTIPGAAISSAPLSDVECYKQHLERHPKDDTVRLSLARAYHKQEQIKLALEQYGLLLQAKSEVLPEVISDMETLVASRPDYLEAHELLADLYMRTGRLQEAVDRYRWILKRVGQTSA